MDTKTHISNPPPGGGGGGWGEAMEDGGSLKPTQAIPSPRDRSPNRQHQNSLPMTVPDGGWGWAIVFANFLITFVITSVNTSFGVVYLHLVKSGYTNVQVAAIPAIVSGISNFLAPVSTGLSCFYSHRRLSLTGVILLSLGLLLSSLFNNIVWLYLCYGIICGVGFALVHPMGFLICQQYFHHKRVSANGLSLLGASVGFISLPMLISYLLEQYSFQGTFLLWSGIVLHGVIGASLLQPVKWHMKPKILMEFDGIKAENNGQAQANSDFPDTKAVAGRRREEKRDFSTEADNDCMVKQLTPDDEESEESDQEEVSINPNISLYNDLKRFSSSYPELYSNRQWKNPLTDSLRTNEYHERPRTVSIERSMEILPQIPEEETEDDCFETFDQETGNEKVEFLNRENDVRNRPASYIGTRSMDSFNTAPSRESVFSASDVFDQFGSALSIEIESRKTKAELEEMKAKGYSRKPPPEPCMCLGLKCPRLSDLISFSMLSHPIFLVSSFSSISNRVAYTCYITYLPAISSDVNEGNGAPYLLTCVAISELLGRILMSIIGERGWISRRYYCVVASISAGLSALILTFVQGIGVFAACCCWYGFSVGMTMTVGPLLLVEYLGIKLLPFTFGLLLIMNGITAVIMLPTTGLLNDLSGGYHLTYRIVSILAAVPGILWGTVPCYSKNQGANKSPADNV